MGMHLKKNHHLLGKSTKIKETHLTLSSSKFHMLMEEGFVLRHYISTIGIKVDPNKIKVIISLHRPKTQKEVCIFLGHVDNYHHFVKKITKLLSPLFLPLSKDI